MTSKQKRRKQKRRRQARLQTNILVGEQTVQDVVEAHQTIRHMFYQLCLMLHLMRKQP